MGKDQKAKDDRPGVDAGKRAEELNEPDAGRVDEQDKPELRPDTTRGVGELAPGRDAEGVPAPEQGADDRPEPKRDDDGNVENRRDEAGRPE